MLWKKEIRSTESVYIFKIQIGNKVGMAFEFEFGCRRGYEPPSFLLIQAALVICELDVSGFDYSRTRKWGKL